MEVDDFNTKTSLFLSWLSNMGVSMSPKIALVDLRSSGRGRAVGEFLIQVLT
jgi:SET domain-containing protein 6